jgi:oxamate amidohydrolase
MNLHTGGHRKGVVCAPHQATVEAGRIALAEGGNAIEAMIAMAATIAVVYPHMNHLGGDGVWLIREPSGRVRALIAAGRAGARARLELYREHESIPARGPLAALTVPGAIAGWMLALEAARAHGARLPLIDLLGDAIRHATEGYAVTRAQARLTAEKLAELEHVPGFAQTFLIDGKAPEVGNVLRQPSLAAMLDHLARAGLDDFYRGDIGREIASDLDRLGSPVTRADLEGTRATLAEPLSVALEAGTAFNTPPQTQGLACLMVLALFERLGITEAEGFDHVHGLVEATKCALRVRDAVITDPDRPARPADRYLDAQFLAAQAQAIDRRKAAAWPNPPAKILPGGTVWMGSADASGLVVSYLQSLYWEFGSGVVLPATGVLMQNRGASFSLARDARNALAPGRLPFHTLTPAIAALDDGRIIAYGAIGGDGQPQTQAAFFTRHVRFHQPIDRAIDAPRWLLGRICGAERANLRMEARFDGNLIDRLVSAGHDVEVLPQPYSDVMGHAGAAVLHPGGTLEAAHDPRADGGAAGV